MKKEPSSRGLRVDEVVKEKIRTSTWRNRLVDG
jgi:hypothetical protein